MYTVKPTGKFQKDLRLAEIRDCNIGLLTAVIKKLVIGETLNRNHRNHPLKGKYKGCQECHISPDWLLIYKINDDNRILYLVRTGTHADLFR